MDQTGVAIANRDQERRLADLLDRLEIEECLRRYCRGIDRHDVELVKSAYHPDARDDHAARVGSGHGLGEWANAVHTDTLGLRAHMHYITNTTIDLEGAEAHVESYFFCAMIREAGSELTFGGGRYLDRFERRSGVWAIADRVVTHEWWNEPEMLKTFGEISIGAAHGGDDPVHARPLRVERPDRILVGPGASEETHTGRK